MVIDEWKYSELEKNQIMKLAQKVFPNSEFVTPEYFDWQYNESPYGPARVFIAKDDEQNIIGIEPIIPMKLLINSKDVMSSLSCNSIVDPKFRNQGIFSKLVSKTVESINLDDITSIYGIPNSKSHKIFVNNGFTEIGRLPLLIRPLKLSGYFSSPIKEIVKPLQIFWRIKESKSDIELIKDRTEFNFDKIIEDLSKRIPILQKRDKEFFEWRYNKHPSRKYEIHVLRENKEIVGYIISRIANMNKKKIGIILDFVYDSKIKNKKGPNDLVNRVLERFWDEETSLSIATCAQNSNEYKILHQSGFKKCPKFFKPEPLYFIIGGINANSKYYSKITNFKNWFFTLGDYDVF